MNDHNVIPITAGKKKGTTNKTAKTMLGGASAGTVPTMIHPKHAPETVTASDILAPELEFFLSDRSKK